MVKKIEKRGKKKDNFYLYLILNIRYYYRMKLQKPTKEFISDILNLYSTEQNGNELNKNLLKLFKTFEDDNNKYNVLIKVAALNKIYSTAITNINPVVEQIIEVNKRCSNLNKLEDYIYFIDEIAKIKWTNKKGESFERNNLSFASKYVHFVSEFQTPIYDSYIWIIIKGYLGQKIENEVTFKNPENFKEFYFTFDKFKKEFNLESYSNYELDKFLWQYGKSLISSLETELKISLEQSKSELKKRLKTNKVV